MSMKLSKHESRGDGSSWTDGQRRRFFLDRGDGSSWTEGTVLPKTFCQIGTVSCPEWTVLLRWLVGH